MSTEGDQKKMIKAAKKRGWVVADTNAKKGAKRRKSNKHIRLQWTDGQRVTISSTPSDSHAIRNAEADLKRIERS
jgi:hypothetical protein